MIYINTEKKFRALISRLQMEDILFMDTEGTSLDPHTNRLLLLQIKAGNDTYVCDFINMSVDALKTFIPVWTSKSIKKVFQNAKYDVKVLFHYMKELPHNIHDTLVSEQLIYAGLNPGGFGLDDIARRRLGIELDKTVRDTFINANLSMFTEAQLIYAAKDVEILPEIYRQQMKDLNDRELLRVYQDEMTLVPVVALMEYTGMPFDPAHMDTLRPQFLAAIKKAHKMLQDLFIDAGVIDEIVFTKDGYWGFNASSPKHQVLPLMQAVGINLSDLNAKTIVQWDFKNRKRAKKYDIAFTEFLGEDEDELANAIEHFSTLENDYLRAYLFYVALNKLYGTYVDGLPELVNPVTQRIHSNFNQARARTGRFGSSKPNLQNIAKDGKLKALGIEGSIRQGFRCMPGRKLIIADYSGIELVIIADASGDESLIDAVIKDEVHEIVTRDVLGWKAITVANKKEFPHKHWRDGAKKLSYSIAYGVQGKTLSDSLTLELAPVGVKFSEQQGNELISQWKSRFPNTGLWLDKNARSVLKYGYVVDGVGRRRFWDVESFGDKWKMLAAQREASNFPVQSLSAHMTKLGLIYTHQGLDLRKARLVSTVHDEIVVESITSYAETAAAILKEGMERSANEVLISMGKYVHIKPDISDRYDK